MWIMCITCCREKLSKILCEYIEQMTSTRKSRELCKTTQKAERFFGKFVKIVGARFLPGRAEICGTYGEHAGQTAREAAKYGGLSYAFRHIRRPARALGNFRWNSSSSEPPYIFRIDFPAVLCYSGGSQSADCDADRGALSPSAIPLDRWGEKSWIAETLIPSQAPDRTPAAIHTESFCGSIWTRTAATC